MTASPQRLPFVLVTPHARVSVVGTRFTVSVAEAASRVDVTEGRVRVERAGGGGTRDVEAGHHAIELTYNHDGRDYELGSQFGHLALGVSDLEAAREELASHGVEFSRGPYRVSAGGSMIAFIRDPDGIEIELIEAR